MRSHRLPRIGQAGAGSVRAGNGQRSRWPVVRSNVRTAKSPAEAGPVVRTRDTPKVQTETEVDGNNQQADQEVTTTRRRRSLRWNNDDWHCFRSASVAEDSQEFFDQWDVEFQSFQHDDNGIWEKLNFFAHNTEFEYEPALSMRPLPLELTSTI